MASDSSFVAENYGFAFNEKRFSDRVLHIQILSEFPDISPCTEGSLHTPFQQAAIANGSLIGDEAVSGDHHKMAVDRPRVVGHIAFHVNSAILAARSKYFYELFSKGTKALGRDHLTVQIKRYEEAAFLEVLKFIYGETLSSTSVPDLLNVLMVAIKLEAALCVNCCRKLLLDVPLTTDLALRYLELPSRVVLPAEVQQPLTEAAKKFLCDRYKDFHGMRDEVMGLPLVGFEVILSADELQAISEDILIDIVLEWAKKHYPELEDRKNIIGSHLIHCIRFPYMSSEKLGGLSKSEDFDQQLLFPFLQTALLSKWEPQLYKGHISPGYRPDSRQFIERDYKHKYVRAFNLVAPHQGIVVYLEFKREECDKMVSNKPIVSQSFVLGGRRLFSLLLCETDPVYKFRVFRIGFGMAYDAGNPEFCLEYKIDARKKPYEDFKYIRKSKHTFPSSNLVTSWEMLRSHWESLLIGDYDYFIDDIFYVRIELSADSAIGG